MIISSEICCVDVKCGGAMSGGGDVGRGGGIVSASESDGSEGMSSSPTFCMASRFTPRVGCDLIMMAGESGVWLINAVLV